MQAWSTKTEPQSILLRLCCCEKRARGHLPPRRELRGPQAQALPGTHCRPGRRLGAAPEPGRVHVSIRICQEALKLYTHY